jgi:hypothetical protein
MVVGPIVALVFGVAALPSFGAPPQASNAQDKHLDVQSSAGDLHVGNDADARKTGLPLYPGARVHHDEDSNAVNLGILTQAFGMKLVVAKYESGDAPEKIVAYYRERLRKYGKVLECHTHEHPGHTKADIDDRDSDEDHEAGEHAKELKCEGDNSGPVTELKVGTQDDQHVVAIEPAAETKDGHSHSTFALVYFHARGQQGDI